MTRKQDSSLTLKEPVKSVPDFSWHTKDNDLRPTPEDTKRHFNLHY
jgi:hypothetical protein